MKTIYISFLFSTLLHILLSIIFSFIVFVQEHKSNSKYKYIEVELLPQPRKIEETSIPIKMPIKKEVKRIKTRSVKEIKAKPIYKKEELYVRAEKVIKDIKAEDRIKTSQEEKSGIQTTSLRGNIPAPVNTAPLAIKSYEEIKETKVHKYAPFTIIGPLSTRRVVYQLMPKLPNYFEEEGILPGEVKLKIYVLEDGRVNRVDIIKSSGYGIWDETVADAVKRWRFYKLPPHITRIDWGYVIVKTYLK